MFKIIIVSVIISFLIEIKAQPFPEQCNSVHFLNYEKGLVAGTYGDLQLWRDIGVIYKTENGGETWSKKYYGSYILRFTKFNVFENGIGYIGAETGANEGSILLKTTDYGETWDTTFIIQNTDERVSSITFLDENSGYFLTKLHLYKTTDGGKNWITTNLGMENGWWWFEYSCFLDMDNGYVCGELTDTTYSITHLILKTSNGGINWETVFNDTLNEVRFLGMDFIDSSFGIAVGGGSWSEYIGFILRTNDGGKSWNINYLMPEDRNHAMPYLTVNIINSSLILVGGQDSELLRSSDGGIEWTTIREYFLGGNVEDIFFLDDNNGWVCYGSIIAKTTDGGKNWTMNSITNVLYEKYPDKYILSQNYPNPFNPSTKIKYSIPSSLMVTLKVYDILGREVATLVNEEKPAGSYEVEFSASNLASGIYFYKLQAGEYTEVKIMILMK